jgi:hypothetical protein
LTGGLYEIIALIAYGSEGRCREIWPSHVIMDKFKKRNKPASRRVVSVESGQKEKGRLV